VLYIDYGLCVCTCYCYCCYVGNRAHIADTVSRLAALPTQLAGSAPGAREYILAFVMLSQDVCVVLLLLLLFYDDDYRPIGHRDQLRNCKSCVAVMIAMFR
jgi:hypothetical protein